MYFEILTLDGYGQFVWPAFIFTFVSCFYLYLKTFKELKKQEKMFDKEFNKLNIVKVKIANQKETLSSSVIF